MKWSLLLCVSLFASCASQGQVSRAERGLEDKTIIRAIEQPHFDILLGSRQIRVGEGKWKIPENNPGWNQMYGWGPVVWITDGAKTRVLDLRSEFPSHFVSQVYDGSGKIFLFLENGIEGPSSSYEVWISQDSGEHWFQGGDLPRPPEEYPHSSIDSFFLEANGHATAWLKLAAYNLSAPQRGTPGSDTEVYYKVTTVDGGLTWKSESHVEFSSLVHSEPELHE